MLSPLGLMAMLEMFLFQAPIMKLVRATFSSCSDGLLSAPRSHCENQNSAQVEDNLKYLTTCPSSFFPIYDNCDGMFRIQIVRSSYIPAATSDMEHDSKGIKVHSCLPV